MQRGNFANSIVAAGGLRMVPKRHHDSVAPPTPPMAHILVIDDENDIRTMIAMVLQHEGHEVTEAENGKVGMARFRAKPADLVITDLVMPEQEGVETIIQLRREFPQLPIIAMSGGMSRSETYLDICRRLGVSGTLAKPFGMAELLKMVKPVLAAKSA